MNRCIIIFFSVFLSSGVYGQQSKIDSLHKIVQTGKTDTLTINALNDLARRFSSMKPDSTIILANRAIELSAKTGFLKGEAIGYTNLGIAHWIKGEFAQALKDNSIALKLFEELNDNSGRAKVLSNTGNIYLGQGNYPNALEYYLKALAINEQIGDKKNMAINLSNIGLVYASRMEYDLGLEYYFKAMKIDQESGNNLAIARHYTNIAVTYDEKAKHLTNETEREKMYELAMQYHLKALKMVEELNERSGIARLTGNIGFSIFEKAKRIGNSIPAKRDSLLQKALEYYHTSLRVREELGAKDLITSMLQSIGSLYITQNRPSKARGFLERAQKLALETGDSLKLRNNYFHLSKLDSLEGNYQSALRNFTKYSDLQQLLFNKENTRKVVQSQMNYEFDKREAVAEAEHKKELEIQQAITSSVIGGLLLVGIFAIFIFRSLRITSRQKKIIEIQQSETEKQKQIIEEKNKDITDSINYAKRIQNAKFPPKEHLRSFLDAFVLFRPKDIVSGDFYFAHRKNGTVYIAAADCTGHGVPGAFMSMIGSDKLEDAILQSSDTSDILEQLNKSIKNALRQNEDVESTRDGMDIALCALDTPTLTLRYAGANRPLWIIRKEDRRIEEIKATKKAIGGFTEYEQYFDSHEIKLNQGDTFYIFSDGYADTFSGTNGKKLTTKKFKEILLSISDKSTREQERYLDDFLESWKAGTEQVDDVLIIGVQV